MVVGLHRADESGAVRLPPDPGAAGLRGPPHAALAGQLAGSARDRAAWCGGPIRWPTSPQRRIAGLCRSARGRRSRRPGRATARRPASGHPFAGHARSERGLPPRRSGAHAGDQRGAPGDHDGAGVGPAAPAGAATAARRCDRAGCPGALPAGCAAPGADPARGHHGGGLLRSLHDRPAVASPRSTGPGADCRAALAAAGHRRRRHATELRHRRRPDLLRAAHLQGHRRQFCLHRRQRSDAAMAVPLLRRLHHYSIRRLLAGAAVGGLPLSDHLSADHSAGDTRPAGHHAAAGPGLSQDCLGAAFTDARESAGRTAAVDRRHPRGAGGSCRALAGGDDRPGTAGVALVGGRDGGGGGRGAGRAAVAAPETGRRAGDRVRRLAGGGPAAAGVAAEHRGVARCAAASAHARRG